MRMKKKLIIFPLIFIVTAIQSQSLDTSSISFENSLWHCDLRIGFTNNFVNAKTMNYLDNYGNLYLGTALYYKNIVFSYCFNPTTIVRVKKPFSNHNGDTIRKYTNTFWETKDPYGINLIKHNFDIGYEIGLNKKNSLTPTLGFALAQISIKEPNLNFKKLPSYYDLNFGLSYKRYIEVTKAGRFFYGIQGYAGYSNISNSFSALGNFYWSLTIHCGAKFVPKGLLSLGILQALTSR